MFITPYIYRLLIYLPTIPKGIYCLLRLFGKIAGKHILKIINSSLDLMHDTAFSTSKRAICSYDIYL